MMDDLFWWLVGFGLLVGIANIGIGIRSYLETKNLHSSEESAEAEG